MTSIQNLFVPHFTNRVHTVIDANDPPELPVAIIDSLGREVDITNMDLILKLRDKLTGRVTDLGAPENIHVVSYPRGIIQLRFDYGQLYSSSGYTYRILGNEMSSNWVVLARGDITIKTPLMQEGVPGGFYGAATLGNLTVDWDDVLNKPLVFPPAFHTHIESQITNLNRMRFVGDWLGGSYEKNDVVIHFDSSWVADEDTTQEPSHIATDWSKLGVLTSIGGGGVHVGPDAPLNPDNGSLWINTVSTRIYAFWDDGTSWQWVDVSK